MAYPTYPMLRLLLLLGASFLWETTEADANISSTEHSTENLTTSSNIDCITEDTRQNPKVNNTDYWPKKELQALHVNATSTVSQEQFDNETLSVDYTILVSESQNELDHDLPHPIHRYNADDMSKVLIVVYDSSYEEAKPFNYFSAYNLYDTLKAEEKKCAQVPQRDGSCACDPDCRKYGDCCPDSKYFKSQEQRLGSSHFKCTHTAKGDVFTVSSCPSEWNDPFVRYKCEHPDLSYGDPLRYVPVTSFRTNISYRSSHCAVCNNDFLHNNIKLWHISAISANSFFELSFEDPMRRMIYVTENSTWYFNLTGAYANISYFPLYSCQTQKEIKIMYGKQDHSTYTFSPENPYHTFAESPLVKCWMLPNLPTKIKDIVRPCKISIDKCAENWRNTSVKQQCEAYYAPVFLYNKAYRNIHCVICNNWDPTVKVLSQKLHMQFGTDWEFTQYPCDKLHVYDPFSLRCRLLFDPEEYKAEHIQRPASERLMVLQSGEYVLSNDRLTAFVPAHNRLYNQHEFATQDQQLLLYLSRSFEGQYIPELDYVSITSACVSIIMLILHIIVSILIPESSNMEKNIRSFCLSLLLLNFSFLVSGSMTLGTTSCMISAAVLHCALLVYCFWMLIIPFDVFRAIKCMVDDKNFQQDSIWGTFRRCSSSWLIPITIVGLALVVDLVNPESSFAPGYGKPICWFNRSSSLVNFCLVPIALVMFFNMVITSWSAYLIFDCDELLVFPYMLHTDFRFCTRLVILTNLTWIVGIISACVTTHGVWHIFSILHALQGVYIFSASSFTQIGNRVLIQ